MKRISFASWPCSAARALDLFGDQWTPLVLREAAYGISRFDDFQRELGIARTTLSDRLGRLVAAGVLEQRVYERRPVRHEYLLTASGREFFDVILVLTRWGDRWLAGESGEPVRTRHAGCGHDFHAEVVCSHCKEPVPWDEVTARPGPGYPAKLLNRPDVRARFGLDEPATGGAGVNQ